MNDNYKSTYEAQAIIGCSYQTVLNYIHKGIFTEIVYRDGYRGKAMMYIPEKQVYRIKEERDKGRVRFRGYPEEEKPTLEDLRANRITALEDAIIELEFKVGRLHILLDRLKDC